MESKMKTIVLMTVILLASTLTALASDGLTDSAVLKLNVSSEYLAANHIQQTIVLRKCENLRCRSIAKDINDSPVDFNQRLVLRPGNYELRLVSEFASTNPLRVKLKSGEFISVNLTEAYFHEAAGQIKARIVLDLDEKGQFDAFSRYLLEMKSGFPFDISTLIWNPPGRSQGYGLLAIEENRLPKFYYYEFCRALSNASNQYPSEAAACSEALAKKAITFDLWNEIQNITKLNSSTFSIMSYQKVESFFGCEETKVQNELHTYLNLHPNTFIWGAGASATRGILCDALQPTRRTFHALTANLADGEALLLTPGAYKVRFSNESGSEREADLKIKANQHRVTL
jgi:hypothetical protein